MKIVIPDNPVARRPAPNGAAAIGRLRGSVEREVRPLRERRLDSGVRGSATWGNGLPGMGLRMYGCEEQNGRQDDVQPDEAEAARLILLDMH